MNEFRRHVVIDVDGAAATQIDAVRSRWDPVMQWIAPPHVTVVYPEQTVDEARLLLALADVTTAMTAFDLQLGVVESEDQGRGGVLVRVDDQSGSLEALRDRLLLPPQRFLAFPFHATLAHPRTATSLEECWASQQGRTFGDTFRVREVLWTLTDRSVRTVLSRFPLQGRAPTHVTMTAGILLDTRDRVLLGLRHPGRAVSPAVWDFPGGHVKPGESARRALHRELTEELGIDAVLEAPWRRVVDDELRVDLSIWVIRRWQGTIANTAPNEHQRIEWFDRARIETVPLADPRYQGLVGGALHA